MERVVRNRQTRRTRVFFIGNYLPRNCGIATFTFDLSQAVGAEIGGDSYGVIAINNIPEGYRYPEQVVFEIQQNKLGDYALAADFINLSGADIVCLQHEFGIFGGPEGSYIVNLLANLRKPVVTTLHTVLSDPTPGYRGSLLDVAGLSEMLIVLSQKSYELLVDVYEIPEERIAFVHHGVPDVPFVDPNYYKEQFNVEGRIVLLTFGLLSPNKGIENMLAALPSVIEKHPHVAYIILGATHPEVKRLQGESYRASLERKVRELGLERHVIFHNRFVTLEQLCEFIGACDIYVTPYLSKEQIVSGTLAYAIGMGKAVVSTPYWYAQEMLADGRGRLVDFGDIEGLAKTVNELIDNEPMRHHMRREAYKFGRQMVWREVGRKYVDIFESLSSRDVVRVKRIEHGNGVPLITLPESTLPDLNLAHLKKLTDDVGIIQHASYGIPDRKHGYSADDVARALVAVLRCYQQFQTEDARRLATVYLAFLRYARLEDGRFHNFMDYSRHFLDEVGGEDTIGRVTWALGCAVALGPDEGFRALARAMMDEVMGHLSALTYPRAMAYAICGLRAYLQWYSGASVPRRMIELLAQNLLELYKKSSSPDWAWFEDILAYGNAKLSEALLVAYQELGCSEYLEVGLNSLQFLTEQLFNGSYFDLVGNDGWYRRGGTKATFGQQPIDAGYLVEAYSVAHEITGEARYKDLAQAAFEWFLGRNRLGVPLYDAASGACSDGLDPDGASMNQGAEALICFLLALLAMSQQRMRRTLADIQVASELGS